MKNLIILLLCCFAQSLRAQDTTNGQHLKVSLLTCGTGDELYTTFGHSAIRISNPVTGSDLVYNYGTFDGFDPDFEWKFMKGKLLYYISQNTYESFVKEYEYTQRFVHEQQLVMTAEQKKKLQSLLETNLQPQNREYKYDFILDNCATRIRDIIAMAYGPGFGYGVTIPSDQYITFRKIINDYLFAHHWERVGINILLGTPVDKKIHTHESMFIPDYLEKAMAGATFNSMNAAQPKVTVVAETNKRKADWNVPLICFSVLLLLTAIAFYRPIKPLRDFLQFFILFLTGVLGSLMLFMWWGTDHQACNNNFNIFWALPTHLIVAFLPKMNLKLYGIAGIIFLLLIPILQVTLVQSFAWFELTPLWLCLLIIYRSMIKKGLTINENNATI